MTNPRDLERGDKTPDAPPSYRRREGGTTTSLRDDAVAVVIGINTYQDPKIPDLRCARADAQAVYDVLTDPEIGRFKPQNVMLLLDGDATERRIRSALGTQLPRRAPKDGTVVIYYAGHGAPVVSPGAAGDGIAKYLVPFDAQADDLEASAIPMTKIQEYFQRLNTSQVICFLDSCYSGSAGGRSFEYGDVQVRAVLTDEFLDSLANEGRFVVTSCATNEVSLESNALGHGVFTYYLVKGLQGAADTDEDGKVTIDELYTYVYNNVEKEARALGGSMNPLRKGAVRGTVYLTEFESANQRAARLANDAGESAWDRSDLAAAEASWSEVLRLAPGHERATFGLAAITERRAREDAERRELERKREEELTGLRRKLLDLANAQELSMREFNEAMSLLEQDAAAMAPRERTLRRYLDSLLRGELSPRAYRQSSALLVADGSAGSSPAPRAAADAQTTAPAPALRPPPTPRASAPVNMEPAPAPRSSTPPAAQLAHVQVPSRPLRALWPWIGMGVAVMAAASWLFRLPDDLATSPAPSETQASTPAVANVGIGSGWAALGTTACNETESHSFEPEGVRDYSCRFLKTVSLAALEQMAGVPVFVSGPHGSAGLNLGSYRFGHYNPQFVTWATEHLVPDVSALPVSIRERLRDRALTYARVNTWLAEHPNVMKSLETSYARAVRDAPPDVAPGGEAPRGYNGPSFNVFYDNRKLTGPIFDSEHATIAAGFWVRRQIDGTRPLFAAAVDKLLRASGVVVAPTSGAAPRAVPAPAMAYRLTSTGSGGAGIAVSPDGRQVALASTDTLLRAWSTASGALQYSVRSGGVASTLVYSRDGRLLASANGDNTVRVFDAVSGATRFASPANGTRIMLAAVFSGDSRTLVTSGTGGRLYVWDVTTGELLRNVAGHVATVHSLALSPDGQLLASSGADGTLKFWNAFDYSEVASLAIGGGMSIAFSPSGGQLAFGMYDGKVQLIDVGKRASVRTIALGSPILRVAWSPDGRRVASLALDTLFISDAATGERRFAIPTRDARGLAWSADGTHMATSQLYQGATFWVVPK